MGQSAARWVGLVGHSASVDLTEHDENTYQNPNWKQKRQPKTLIIGLGMG